MIRHSSSIVANTKSKTAKFDPIKWSQYWEKQENLTLDSGTFHYYTKGSSGPILLLIHGAGFSALSWSLFANAVSSMIEVQVIAVDIRGHGNTVTNNDTDLRLERLAMDLCDFIKLYCPSTPIIVVGNSLGGSIAVEVSTKLQSIVAVCTVDVVDVTVAVSTSHLESVVRDRPKHFNSVQEAIAWSRHSGLCNNLESAKVSVPGQLVNEGTEKLASEEDDWVPARYKWRIDLHETQPYWEEWFRSFSENFVKLPMPKLLVVTNMSKLDKTLLVAQMQGKYQVKVLQFSGHLIQEDRPEELAQVVSDFLIKQKIVSSSLNQGP